MDYSSHFSINNIPYGIASSPAHPKRSIATRFENTVIYLDTLAAYDINASATLREETISTFTQSTLNAFAGLPTTAHISVRTWIQSHITDSLASLPPSDSGHAITSSINQTTLHLPLAVGDFTDYSCSSDHVLNAGEAVFGKRSLPPGFPYFPIGYHGRSSTIGVSGSDVVRPKGMFKVKKEDESGKEEVAYGASRKLDYELEVAAVVGKSTEMGSVLGVDEAEASVFGLVLLNDWSARDIQSLEMQPLGPMNGKSFATTISPWVIPLAALSPFRCAGPARDPTIAIAPYLQSTGSSDANSNSSFDISLCVSVKANGAKKSSVTCKSNFRDLYWSVRDMVAQQTSNGCSLRTGDLLATGTISGSAPDSHGCLLELGSKGGVEIVVNGERQTRLWLEDGDVVTMTGVAGQGVGFGECVGRILGAK